MAACQQTREWEGVVTFLCAIAQTAVKCQLHLLPKFPRNNRLVRSRIQPSGPLKFATVDMIAENLMSC